VQTGDLRIQLEFRCPVCQQERTPEAAENFQHDGHGNPAEKRHCSSPSGTSQDAIVNLKHGQRQRQRKQVDRKRSQQYLDLRLKVSHNRLVTT
jgi:hypothetical protein